MIFLLEGTLRINEERQTDVSGTERPSPAPGLLLPPLQGPREEFSDLRLEGAAAYELWSTRCE